MKYDGKFASRWRAKSPDALCAVLPIRDFSYIFSIAVQPEKINSFALNGNNLHYSGMG